jgi:hypothetical protein
MRRYPVFKVPTESDICLNYDAKVIYKSCGIVQAIIQRYYILLRNTLYCLEGTWVKRFIFDKKSI